MELTTTARLRRDRRIVAGMLRSMIQDAKTIEELAPTVDDVPMGLIVDVASENIVHLEALLQGMDACDDCEQASLPANPLVHRDGRWVHGACPPVVEEEHAAPNGSAMPS